MAADAGGSTRVLDRIKKTLALAGNNPNAEEAHAAMLKAQALLVQHGLTMRDVAGQKSADGVRDAEATRYRRMTWWEKALAHLIGSNFRCEAYVQRQDGRSQICFIGLQQDVPVAVQVFNFARESMRLLWDAHRAARGLTHPARIAGARNEFMQGFLSGLGERFSEQVAAQDWGLILVRDPVVDEAVARKRLRKAPPAGARRWGDAEARRQGYADGRAFDPERRNVLGD